MKNQNEDLTAEVRAINRATRAIRALVRFLLVQLLFITGAAALLLIGELTAGDPVACTLYGEDCGGRTAFQFLAGLIFLVGVVLSSRIAWAELALSDPSLEVVPVAKNILHAPSFESGSEFSAQSPSVGSGTKYRTCQQCGKESEIGFTFCTACGSKYE